MTEAVVFTSLVMIFLPFILFAGRERLKKDQTIAARFLLVRSRFNVDSEKAALSHNVIRSVREEGQEPPPAIERSLRFVLRLLRYEELRARAGTKSSGAAFLLVCGSTQVTTGCVIWFLTGNLIGASVLGFVAGYAPVMILRIQCGRRLKSMEKVLPQVVDMMARALRAGHSLPAAFSIVAEQAPEPARQEFGELFRKQKFGFPLREALVEMLERVPSQDLRVLVVGILVQRETGGNMTVILDRTSNVIRERLKLQGDVLVHTAQGRLTGWILCGLPVLLFVMIHIVNPGYTRCLTEDPLGRKCLYGGLGLLALGAFLIRKIVSGIEV